MIVGGDLADPEAPEHALEEVAAQLGPVEVLARAAGQVIGLDGGMHPR